MEFALNQSLNLKSNQNISPELHSSTETLTLPTACYAVDFNEDFVIISLLK